MNLSAFYNRQADENDAVRNDVTRPLKPSNFGVELRVTGSRNMASDLVHTTSFAGRFEGMRQICATQ